MKKILVLILVLISLAPIFALDSVNLKLGTNYFVTDVGVAIEHGRGEYAITYYTMAPYTLFNKLISGDSLSDNIKFATKISHDVYCVEATASYNFLKNEKNSLFLGGGFGMFGFSTKNFKDGIKAFDSISDFKSCFIGLAGDVEYRHMFSSRVGITASVGLPIMGFMYSDCSTSGTGSDHLSFETVFNLNESHQVLLSYMAYTSKIGVVFKF